MTPSKRKNSKEGSKLITVTPSPSFFDEVLSSQEVSTSISAFQTVSQTSQTPTRPVNELIGSLIDINSFGGYSSQLHLGDSGQRHSDSLHETEKFEQHPKLTYDCIFNMSDKINNEVPIIQAEVIPEDSSPYDATPTEYFQYNPETIGNNSSSIPIAPAFTSVDDESPMEQAHTVTQKTRFGSDMGRIQAVEEKERIKRISANAKGLPYFDSQRIAAASEIAKQRVREGFDVKGDKYFDESNLLAARRARSLERKGNDCNGGSASSSSGSAGGRGYQVSEYNVEEYDCKPYDTTEYKSVYD